MAEVIKYLGEEYTDELHAQVEHMVDTQGISYHDARLALGIADVALNSETVSATPEPLSAASAGIPVTPLAAFQARGARRTRYIHGPQLGEEHGVGMPGGLPHELQPRPVWDAEQSSRNAAWFAALRTQLAAQQR